MHLPDDDHRCHLAGTTLYGRLCSLRETRSIIRRSIGAHITRNFSAWFADISRGGGRSGVPWTGEKEVAELIGEMNRIYRRAIDTGHTSASEIAVEQLTGREQIEATLVASGHPLSAGLGDGHRLSARGFTPPATVRLHPTEFGPRFRIAEGAADIVARFADGKGAPAARDFGDW